jgi:hypothetical protein
MLRIPPSSIEVSKSDMTFGKSRKSMSPIIEASSIDEQSQNDNRRRRTEDEKLIAAIEGIEAYARSQE